MYARRSPDVHVCTQPRAHALLECSTELRAAARGDRFEQRAANLNDKFKKRVHFRPAGEEDRDHRSDSEGEETEHDVMSQT